MDLFRFGCEPNGAKQRIAKMSCHWLNTLLKLSFYPFQCPCVNIVKRLDFPLNHHMHIFLSSEYLVISQFYEN